MSYFCGLRHLQARKESEVMKSFLNSAAVHFNVDYTY